MAGVKTRIVKRKIESSPQPDRRVFYLTWVPIFTMPQKSESPPPVHHDINKESSDGLKKKCLDVLTHTLRSLQAAISEGLSSIHPEIEPELLSSLTGVPKEINQSSLRMYEDEDSLSTGLKILKALINTVNQLEVVHHTSSNVSDGAFSISSFHLAVDRRTRSGDKWSRVYSLGRKIGRFRQSGSSWLRY